MRRHTATPPPPCRARPPDAAAPARPPDGMHRLLRYGPRDPRVPHGRLGGGVRVAAGAPLPRRANAETRRRGARELSLLARGRRPQSAVGEAVRAPPPDDLRAQEAANRDTLSPAGAARARRAPRVAPAPAPCPESPVRTSAPPPSSLPSGRDVRGPARPLAQAGGVHVRLRREGLGAPAADLPASAFEGRPASRQEPRRAARARPHTLRAGFRRR